MAVGPDRDSHYIPVTAPFVVPIRFAFSAIGGWEIALSILISVLAIGVLVRIGGRVYAGGLLRTGTKVAWRDAFRSSEL